MTTEPVRSATTERTRAATRLVALLVLAALFVVAVRRLDLARATTELTEVRPLWIALALVCYLALLPLWALQWSLLSPGAGRPSVARMLGVVAMTSSVLNTTPLLVGEAAGVFFLCTRAGLERGTALSVMAMDQLLVGIAKVCVLIATAWTNELPAWMERGAVVLGAGVVGLLVGLVILEWRADAIAALAMRALPPRAGGSVRSHGERLARLIGTAATALAPLRSPTRGGGALLLALAKKLVEIGAIICVQHAFGLSLPFGSALLVLATLNLATLLPVVPGNVGVYEAAVVLAYGWLGVSPERALGIAVVQHACFFAAVALPGYRWLAQAAVPRSPAATP